MIELLKKLEGRKLEFIINDISWLWEHVLQADS